MSETRVLIVEDESHAAQYLCDKLQKLGYRVVGVVASGEQAVRAATETCPDVILMDVYLEGEMDGVEAAALIGQRQDVPVIYLTAHADAGLLRRAKVTEPFGYLLKPFKERELHVSIEIARYKHEKERALRESKQHYQRLIESSGDMILSVDREGVFKMAGGTRLQDFGLTPKEVVGRSLDDLFAPEEAQRYRAQHKKVFESGQALAYEQTFQFAGVTQTDLTTIYPIKDERGKVELVGVICRDITAQKHVQEALERRMEQLSALSQASQAVTASLDLDQVLARVVSLMTEATASDYTSVVLVDRAGRLGKGTENLPGGQAIQYRIRKEGMTRWIIDTRRPLVVDDIDADGNIIPAPGGDVPRAVNRSLLAAGIRSVAGLPLVAKDNLLGVLYLHSLTPAAFKDQLPLLATFANQAAVAIENARLYETAQKERDRAQKYLDVAGVMLVALDGAGRVSLINKKGCEILGYAEAEMIGTDWFANYLPQRLQGEVRAIFGQLMKGQLETVEYVEQPILTRSGQERLIAWHNTLLRDEAGNVVGTLSSGEDITERHRAEQQTRAALREKDALLREIHHRVKNNLQVVCALLDLQADGVTDDAIREVLQASQDRIHSMAHLHEQLTHSQNLAQVNMQAYIQDLVGTLSMTHDVDGIDFEIDAVAVTLPFDLVSPCGLLINELVSNAIRHAFAAGQAGQIHIGLRPLLGARKRIELVVSDTGSGLPPGVDPRDPSSLGLTLVNLLTRQLDGNLQIEQGRGTTFRVLFNAGTREA